MTARTKSLPGDHTGVAREKAAAAAAAEQEEASKRLSMVRQVELDSNNSDVFDPATEESLGAFESIELKKNVDVVIRVVEDIDDMTFGAGTSYTFKVGKQYKVSQELAEELSRLGYVQGA